MDDPNHALSNAERAEKRRRYEAAYRREQRRAANDLADLIPHASVGDMIDELWNLIDDLFGDIAESWMSYADVIRTVRQQLDRLELRYGEPANALKITEEPWRALIQSTHDLSEYVGHLYVVYMLDDLSCLLDKYFAHLWPDYRTHPTSKPAPTDEDLLRSARQRLDWLQTQAQQENPDFQKQDYDTLCANGWLTVPQAVGVWHKSRRTIYRWMHRGKIPSRKIGQNTYVRKEPAS